MSGRLFQNVIRQMKNAVNRTIGVTDEQGVIISSTDETQIGATKKLDNFDAAFNISRSYTSGGYTFLPVINHKKFEFCVFVEGEDEIAKQFCSLTAISLSNIKQYYDEKYDRSSFIKNLLLGNVLPVDAFSKTKELHISGEVSRVIFLIRILKSNEFSTVLDVLQNLFPEKSKDFIININGRDIVLVKEIKKNTLTKELEKLANTIVSTIQGELMIKTAVGIGTTVNSIGELARSYQEAEVALEVGKVFDTEKEVISYENLGIGRLIYQLPTTLCEMFLAEAFKNKSIENLDQETVLTIQKFFENNLNVSETARSLFVHRNTMVYRLEKVKRITGLDIRNFDHAVIFKVAMMVKKYLSSNPLKI
jgi:carbohydrate diacid regulator